MTPAPTVIIVGHHGYRVLVTSDACWVFHVSGSVALSARFSVDDLGADVALRIAHQTALDLGATAEREELREVVGIAEQIT